MECDDHGIEIKNDFSFRFSKIQKAKVDALVVITDASLRKHLVVKLNDTTSKGKNTKGKKYVKPRKHIECGKPSVVKCLECYKVYCYPVKKQYNPSQS